MSEDSQPKSFSSNSTYASYERPVSWVTEVASRLRAVVNEQQLEEDRRIQGILSLLQKLTAFINEWNTESVTAAAFHDSRILEVEGDHVSRLLIEMQSLSEFAEALRVEESRLDEVGKADLRIDALESTVDEFLRGSATFLLNNAVAGATQLVALIDRTRADVRNESSRIRIELSRGEAEDAVQAIRVAAGTFGDTVLHSYFEQTAVREARSANLLRWSVIICSLVVVIVAAYWTLYVEPQSVDPARDLTKLAVSIPIAGLAIYLARESGKHRAISNWSAEITVQLRTLEAFIGPLDEQQRTQLRAQFGLRVFGVRPTEVGSKDELPIVHELADVASKVSMALKPGK